MSDQTNITIVRKFLDAIERFDTEALDELLGPSARQVEMPNALNPRGGRKDRAGMLDGLAKGSTMLTWQKCELGNAVADNGLVFAEWSWSGEVAADLGPLHKGQRLHARCVAVIEIANGKIGEVRNYDCYDQF
jgi:ketosteroid isomerase-like protein